MNKKSAPFSGSLTKVAFENFRNHYVDITINHLLTVEQLKARISTHGSASKSLLEAMLNSLKYRKSAHHAMQFASHHLFLGLSEQRIANELSQLGHEFAFAQRMVAKTKAVPEPTEPLSSKIEPKNASALLSKYSLQDIDDLEIPSPSPQSSNNTFGVMVGAPPQHPGPEQGESILDSPAVNLRNEEITEFASATSVSSSEEIIHWGGGWIPSDGDLADFQAATAAALAAMGVA